MNLKKQQLIAISLAFCCAAVMPLQAEARKKENKTNETQPVVSSVPQPRSQKQVLIQNTPTESRRITTPNQSKVQVRTIAAAPQLTAKEAKKAAKEKEKEAKKKSKEKNKTKQQKNETPIINRNNDKAGSREGVRQDLAFAQALVETGFFRFGGDVKPEQNNFCGLGTTGGGVKGAHFKTPEIGVRAHIQHLLAYTTQKHPSTKIVDPRYDLAHAIRLERGLCDTWYKLNGTWAMSPNYSEKIMGVWQRMLGIEAVETKSEKYKNEHDKKDNKVKEEVNTTEDQHKMRELVDELLKKNK